MRRLPLRELAARYFKRLGYAIETDVEVDDVAGKAHKLDMLVRREGEVRPVWIKDWRRTVGVNVIINVDLEAEELGLGKPIVVGNRISDRARSYASRRGILLLTPGDLEEIL
ncbi:MAG TPA: hypothetical protein ENG43_01030 [Candidatus Bathyarchaeota archaeon]|nr:hypothetical protein [Candidatus Bathyarchaeota archaeon]HEW89911.1 hypothetical protein [Candidatus Bathyarchaeota archaeon]